MATAELWGKIREASKMMHKQGAAPGESLQQYDQLQTPHNRNTHLATPPTSVPQFERITSYGSSYPAGSQSYVQAASPLGGSIRGFDDTPLGTDATGITVTGDNVYATPGNLNVEIPRSAYGRNNSETPDYYRHRQVYTAIPNPPNGGMANVDHYLQPSTTPYDALDSRIPGYGQSAQIPVNHNHAPSYHPFHDRSISAVRDGQTHLDQHHDASHDSVRPIDIENTQTPFGGNRNLPMTPRTGTDRHSSQYQGHFDINTAMAYLRPGINRVKGIDSWPAWLESPAAQNQVVEQLFDAVYSLEIAQDGPNGGWTESVPYKSIAASKTDPKKIEAYCWRLFVNVRDIHVNGCCFTREKPPTVTMAVKTELREMFGMVIDSNEDIKTHALQRFEYIKYALRRSKIFLNDLEDQGKSKMLALAPLGMLSKKGVYRANNMQKQARLREQRELRKAVEEATRDVAAERPEENDAPPNVQDYLSSAHKAGKKRSREDEDDDLSKTSNKRVRNAVNTRQTETTDLTGYGSQQPRSNSSSPRLMVNGTATRRHLGLPSSRKVDNSLAIASPSEQWSSQTNGNDSSPLAQYGHGASPNAQSTTKSTADSGLNPNDHVPNTQFTQRNSQPLGSDDDLEATARLDHSGSDRFGASEADLLSPSQQEQLMQFQNDRHVGYNTPQIDPRHRLVDDNDVANDHRVLDNHAPMEWGLGGHGVVQQDTSLYYNELGGL